jgi:hypothetical protein
MEYLLFKMLPLPQDSAIELVLTAPGQPSVQPNARGFLSEPEGPALLGGINLSDEEASVIFLNLSDETRSETAWNEKEKRSFLLEHSDYPLTRLKLKPREGYWLPKCSIIMDRDTSGRTEIDVHLAIKQLT